MGPEVMIASNLAQAAIRTAIDYNEANAPTPDELWEREQLALLESRAERGDLEAHYELGRAAARKEQRDAEHWICVAANRGHPKSLLQMGHWYNEDRDEEDQWPYIAISPDNRKAWVYYSLAAERGEPVGAAYRDALADRAMNETELRAAEQRLAAWKPVTCPYVVAVREPARPFDAAER